MEIDTLESRFAALEADPSALRGPGGAERDKVSGVDMGFPEGGDVGVDIGREPQQLSLIHI